MVTARFSLDSTCCEKILRMTPRFGFGTFGEVIYYRTYSRMKSDGSHETWGETVIRVINGLFSIRKNHYLTNGLGWEDASWQPYACKMAEAMFRMQWLPPGRGLWVMGTTYVYERGSAALNNCGAVDTADLALAVEWAMDMLMCGVGVGFNTAWRGEGVSIPKQSDPVPFVIPDSREGWVESVRKLIESYTNGRPKPRFDYTAIRPEGSPIRGFGGSASGPGPLRQLHKRIESYLDHYCGRQSDATRCVADIFNAIGACVVAGNVRRSAEIALGSVSDRTFLDLKNYALYPERREIGWISNNTVILREAGEFEQLAEVAKRICQNGEPGMINLQNVEQYGRMGDLKPDAAWLANPCSEIALESFELCNLAEVFPSLCANEAVFYEALEMATFYASTVALLTTHRKESNAVMARNRRIGVSLSGITQWMEQIGKETMIARLRAGYIIVKTLNQKLAAEAQVPPSVRVTTVKPSGTISLLAGVTPGMHFAPFRYAIRRIRIGSASPMADLLKEAGVPNEPDCYSEHTTVFEFPVAFETARSAASVSAREQLELLTLLQREWSDNMVSCTVTFDPEKEGGAIESLLQEFVPKLKSLSLLPQSPQGVYSQMPYEAISQEEYQRRMGTIPPIDWQRLGSGSEARESLFCTGDFCERSGTEGK